MMGMLIWYVNPKLRKMDQVNKFICEECQEQFINVTCLELHYLKHEDFTMQKTNYVQRAICNSLNNIKETEDLDEDFYDCSIMSMEDKTNPEDNIGTQNLDEDVIQ